MLVILFSLLVLSVERCTGDQIFETKTVGLGQNVTLTCDRQTSWTSTQLFWIRIVPGNMAKVLGGTYSFDYKGVNKIPRITAKQGPETFLLHISETQLSDTGFYYCIKQNQLDMTFLRGTFLTVEGPEPHITDIVQLPPSDPVRPGDSVTLQCSVLSDSEKKTCSGDHRVFWFRARSGESTPSLIYAHRNSNNKCEKSPEAHSPQKCVYSLSKSVSSSDAGTYYCAVATCGEILFGNGTKLEIEALNTWDLQKANTAVYLLGAALASSLIVIGCLIYSMKKKSCGCWRAGVVLETNAAAASGSQQRNEDSLTYSAPTFTKRKAGKAERRNVKPSEKETVYSDIRTFAKD